MVSGLVTIVASDRVVKAVLTLPPATSRPEEKSPWPALVPVAVMETSPRLITPPLAVIVTLVPEMVVLPVLVLLPVLGVLPATALAPARVMAPESERMVREEGVAADANQLGPVLMDSAPARIVP